MAETSGSSELTHRNAPVFVVKTGTMSRRDINRLEKLSGFLVVESAEPETVRYLEPPVDADVPAQARAALSLFRMIKASTETTMYRQNLMKLFLDVLMDAPPPRVVRVKR